MSACTRATAQPKARAYRRVRTGVHAELDTLDEYMVEMVTPLPRTYTFTEAELDTLMEWRMGGGM